MKTQLLNQRRGLWHDMVIRKFPGLLHMNRSSAFLVMFLVSTTWLPLVATAQRPAGTVVCWGAGRQGTTGGYPFGQSTPPKGLSGVIDVEAGRFHSLALKQDGTVVAWGGYDWSGQSKVPSDLGGVIAIAAGSYYSLALKQDGTVVGWGSSGDQFPTNEVHIEELVPTGLSGVVALAAGDRHCLALKQDGTVVAWGLGLWNPDYGQTNVPTGLSGVVAIAAGYFHNLALKQDGTVVAWGMNDVGQATVPSSLNGVIAVAAGSGHSLALKQDGTVVGWGYNGYGQAKAPSGLSGVIAVAAGGWHSLALKQDGTVVGWGDNLCYQSTVPTDLGEVIAVAAGFAHSLSVVNPASLAPTITKPPQTQTAESGSTFRFHVLADGAPPLNYQWFFDTTNALGSGTNRFLDLPNVRPSQAGTYTVVATNHFGSVTSAPAVLSVIPPVPRSVVPAINLTGKVGGRLALSYANTLGPGANWQSLDVVALGSTSQIYLDLSAPLPPERFYRAWQTNVASVNPSMQMSLATEIPLAGVVGTKVRIDFIQAVGPTDAWVTLDTVTLTNTIQPYFDVTMFQQPTRLYRIVPVP
jgi:hypothetical protein